MVIYLYSEIRIRNWLAVSQMSYTAQPKLSEDSHFLWNGESYCFVIKFLWIAEMLH